MNINEVSGGVVHAAMKVHTALGPGLLESAYEACLVYELRRRGHVVAVQEVLPVHYDGTFPSTASSFVELKAVRELLPRRPPLRSPRSPRLMKPDLNRRERREAQRGRMPSESSSAVPPRKARRSMGRLRGRARLRRRLGGSAPARGAHQPSLEHRASGLGHAGRSLAPATARGRAALRSSPFDRRVSSAIRVRDPLPDEGRGRGFSSVAPSAAVDASGA